MGGWACCAQRQFPAGRLPRHAIDRRCIPDANGNRYCNRYPNGDRSTESDSYCYGHGYTDSDVNADSDPNGYGNSYGHAYTVCCA